MPMRFAEDDPCTYKFGHADPDNSGQCIHCGAVIDAHQDDLDQAVEEGRDLATFPKARAYVESMKALAARRH